MAKDPSLAHALVDTHRTSLTFNSFLNRHQDLKPENILHIPDYASKLGTLQTTYFRSNATVESCSRQVYAGFPWGMCMPEVHVDNVKGRSPYEPPEVDSDAAMCLKGKHSHEPSEAHIDDAGWLENG